MFNINTSLNLAIQCHEWSKALSDSTGLTVEVLPCIDSTNSLALSRSISLPSYPQQLPHAWLALKQTHARGRMGRLWHSDGASNQSLSKEPLMQHTAFLASVAFKTQMPLASLGILPLQVGVSIAQYLQSLGVEVGIKWPNDLVLKSDQTVPYKNVQQLSKLGGILIETKRIETDHNHINSHHIHTKIIPDETAVVIGVGLNWYDAPLIAGRDTACVAQAVSQYALPSGLSATAALLTAIEIAWQRTYQQVKCEFAAFDVLAGQMITVENKVNGVTRLINGIACGINAQGHLGIRTEQGVQWLHGGETSLSGFN
jgi:BirA family transcriptional regulator, biotin operon repressor / biotin---[acetyl-CoA-carboxylase] ligase